ncbi:hypothetical protein MTO96_001727 [Rhipicephalus appendiculatus]
MGLAIIAIALAALPPWTTGYDVFFYKPGFYDRKYGSFPEELRLRMVEEAKRMFQFGYDSYMKYAFPKDELNPIYCTGRGPDYDNPSNININDVLGDYSLTLVDSLDTLAVMGNASEFRNAVRLILEHVSFDKDNVVQVFEANIRLLGALLSAHLLITDREQPFGDLRPPRVPGRAAAALAGPGVAPAAGLREHAHGHPLPEGSLLLEFGVLSRLLDDGAYEEAARRATRALWSLRAKDTGLLGNIVDVNTGEWVGKMSGIGAGLDSFFEYLLKTYILFGDMEDFRMFNESYSLIKQYMRKGRVSCNEGCGEHPLYVNVNMQDGSTSTLWIDSLQASFSGIQVLLGDIEEAICSHALFYAIWRRFGALPERFNWQKALPDLAFYPLRPELIESTYLLYRATKNPFYLHVGRDILQSLNNHTKAPCGYATIHNVQDKSLEDRMESFFLSETCKYLYLLFDVDNPLNKHFAKYIFTTEGHILPIIRPLRTSPPSKENVPAAVDVQTVATLVPRVLNETDCHCDKVPEERQYFLPLKHNYLQQISQSLGLDGDV